MSQVKLNLGAGLFPLPYERGKAPNSQFIEPLPDECYEPGWLNIDKHAHQGIDEQIDLFRFPWIRSSNGMPFQSDSIDYIYAAHFLEHVPHKVEPANNTPLGWKEYKKFVEDYDGFFVFFNEVWRVLKPDGLIHVRCPYATTYDALCDPTHTRFIVPGTFGYLTDASENSPFDYLTKARFDMVGNITWRMSDEQVHRMKYLTPDGIDRMLREDYSSVAELRITLRAVK